MDHFGLIRLLEGCEVDEPRALVTCTRVWEEDLSDSRCFGCYPYDFVSCTVGSVSAYDVAGEKSVRGADQRRVTEAEVQVMYAAEFVDEGMSFRFAEVPHDRFLTSNSHPHKVASSEEQSQIVAVTGDDEVDSGLTTEEVDGDFEGLVIVYEMKRTGVREKLRDLQDACRAENIDVPTTIVEFID